MRGVFLIILGACIATATDVAITMRPFTSQTWASFGALVFCIVVCALAAMRDWR